MKFSNLRFHLIKTSVPIIQKSLESLKCTKRNSSHHRRQSWGLGSRPNPNFGQRESWGVVSGSRGSWTGRKILLYLRGSIMYRKHVQEVCSKVVTLEEK